MIPYGLFYIIPTIVAAGVWFVPEVTPIVFLSLSPLSPPAND